MKREQQGNLGQGGNSSSHLSLLLRNGMGEQSHAAASELSQWEQKAGGVQRLSSVSAADVLVGSLVLCAYMALATESRGV